MQSISRRGVFVSLTALLLMWSAACNAPSESEERSEALTLQQDRTERFESMDSSRTGITFVNRIFEDLRFNYFSYGYLYNGGGVAVGDVDGDSLPDLYFAGTMVPNRLYLNRGDFRFEDVTERAGVAAAEGLKTGVCMADIDADGRLDLFVARTGIGPVSQRSNLVYLNNGDGTFTESAAALGLDAPTNTNQAYFVDYDGDGDQDCYLLNHPVRFGTNTRPRLRGNVRYTEPDTPEESDRLYRNDGGRFTDVTERAGIVNSAFGLSVCPDDFDGDGRLDFFVANDYIEPDFLYINNGDGTFTDRYEEFFDQISQNSMGSDRADLDNDGLEDLVVLDMLPEDDYRNKTLMSTMMLDRYETLLRFGYGKQEMRNVLQRNLGAAGYGEIGRYAGIAATDWSWTPLLADFDNDGLKDLFISNGYRRDVTDLDFIKFKNDSINKAGGMQISRIEEVMDRIPEQPLRNYLYHNDGNLRFSDKSAAWGLREETFSAGASWADLDRDGDLDLVVNNLVSPASVYRNGHAGRDDAHWLQVTLNGPAGNPSGIGAQAILWRDGTQQLQEMRTTRGYYSSVEPLLHFGLGAASDCDSLLIRWPDGRSQKLRNLNAGQRLTLDYNDSRLETDKAQAPGPGRFEPVSGPQFTHRENVFSDTRRDFLLPWAISREGPGMASGDVNGDGRIDLFVGGAAGQAGVLFLQGPSASFNRSEQPAFVQDAASEDLDPLLFDADGDGDLDLYVVSGGHAMEAGSGVYQDRLYRNDGSGRFSRDTKALPAAAFSGGAVAAGDPDGDGDLDLFVGGRVVPGSWPLSPPSQLLENVDGSFVDRTSSWAPELASCGMITDAAWADLDGDGTQELVFCGEWTTPRIYAWRDGRLADISEASGTARLHGWWRSMLPADLDGDGDLDLLMGNHGLNSLYSASADQPIVCYANDFDGNGKVDPVLCKTVEGTLRPVAQRDRLLAQIPTLRKVFTGYARYGRATIDDLFPADQLSAALQLRCVELQNGWLENTGGRYQWHPLPLTAQQFPMQDALVMDFNADAIPDVLLAGNFYPNETENGPIDAGRGLLMLGDGNGIFAPQAIQTSGFHVKGDHRSLALIPLGAAPGQASGTEDAEGRADYTALVVLASNDAPLQSFTVALKQAAVALP